MKSKRSVDDALLGKTGRGLLKDVVETPSAVARAASVSRFHQLKFSGSPDEIRSSTRLRTSAGRPEPGALITTMSQPPMSYSDAKVAPLLVEVTVVAPMRFAASSAGSVPVEKDW